MSALLMPLLLRVERELPPLVDQPDAPLRPAENSLKPRPKMFTVSFHCPRETSSSANSPGQVLDTYLEVRGERRCAAGVRFPDLLVEFRRFFAGVPPNGEHDEIVDRGCQRNRAAEISSASCTSTA